MKFAVVFASVAAMSVMASGSMAASCNSASQYAPGQQAQASGQPASTYAPGQQAKTTGQPANTFAPGQVKKDQASASQPCT